MAKFHVPLVIRGSIIDDKDDEYGGRRGGAAFTTPDVKKHAHALPLDTPSALADLYALRRMCKWIIEEEYDPAATPLASKAYAEFVVASPGAEERALS
jgi:hypothetical protein